MTITDLKENLIGKYGNRLYQWVTSGMPRGYSWRHERTLEQCTSICKELLEDHSSKDGYDMAKVIDISHFFPHPSLVSILEDFENEIKVLD